MELETKTVKCPGCGKAYRIRKAGMEEIVELGVIAVPSWFRDSDPETRLLNLGARESKDTRPDAVKWDEATESARMMRDSMAIIREVVLWPKILRRGEQVTDAKNQMAAYEFQMCCGLFLPDAIGDFSAEETEKLANFRKKSKGGGAGPSGETVQPEAE